MTAIMHSPDHRVERSAVSEVDGIGVIVRLAKVLEIVLADVGLTMNQFRLLTLVEDRSPSAAELSRRLVMKPPNVSALTAGMVKRGLIEQRRQLGDGRRRILALTPAARTIRGLRLGCGKHRSAVLARPHGKHHVAELAAEVFIAWVTSAMSAAFPAAVG